MDQQGILLDLALLVNQRHSIAEVYEAFADRLADVAAFDQTSLMVFEPDRRYVRLVGIRPNFGAHAELGVPFEERSVGIAKIAEYPEGTEYNPSRFEGLPGVISMSASGLQRAWVTPLISDGVNYGVFTVTKMKRGAFPEADLQFLRQAARLLASAVRQDETLERARRDAARSALLAELAVGLDTGETATALFDRVPPLLGRALHYDYLNLITVGDTPRTLDLVGRYPELVPIARTRYTFEECKVDRFVARGLTIAEFEPGSTAGDVVGLFNSAGLGRVATALLRHNNEPIGLLNVARRANIAFTEDERSFIELVGTLIGNAIANQLKLAEAGRATARAELLNELALLVNAGEGIQALFEALVQVVDGAIGFDYMNLLVRDERPNTLRMVGRRPLILDEAPVVYTFKEANIDGLMMLERPVVQFEPDPARSGGGGWMARAGIRMAMTTLLRHDGVALGMFSVGRTERHAFEEEDLAFVEHVAALLAQALANQARLAEARAAAARNELLSELAVLLNAGEKIESLVDRMLPLIGRAVKFDWIQLSTAPSLDQRFEVMFSRPEVFAEGGPGTLNQQQIDAIRATGRDYAQYRPEKVSPGPGIDVLIAAGIARACDVLLTIEGAVLGDLVFGRHANVPFAAADLAFLEVVATLLVQAVVQENQLVRARAEAARAELLNELALLVNAGEGIETLSWRFSELIGEAVSFDYIGLTVRSAPHTPFVRMFNSPELFEIGSVADLSDEGIAAISAGGRDVAQYRPEKGVQTPSTPVWRAAGLRRMVDAVLIHQGEVFGLVTLGRAENLAYSAAETRFLEVVATLLAQAVANERRVAEARAEADRNQLLNELAVLLKTGEPIDSLFGRVRDVVFGAVQADFLAMTVRDADGGAYRVVGSEPPLSGIDDGDAAFIAEGMGKVIEMDGDALRFVETDSTWGGGRVLFEAGVKCFTAALLRDRGEVLGALCLGRLEVRPFRPEDLTFLDVVATLLAQSLAAEQRVERANAEAHRNQLLNELALLLNAGEPIDSLFGKVRDVVFGAVSADFIALAVANADGTGYRAVGTEPPVTGLDGGAPRFSLDDMARALEIDGLPQRFSEITQNSDVGRTMWAAGVKSVTVAVLREREGPLGALCLGRFEVRRFHPEEVAFLDVVATLLAQAVAAEHRVVRTIAEAEEQRFIAEIAAAAARESTHGALAAAVIEPFRQVVPNAMVAVGAVDQGQVFYAAPRGEESTPVQLDDHDPRVVSAGQVMHSHPRPDNRGGRRLIAAEVDAWITTACRAGGETVGILVCGSREPGFRFTEREKRLCRLAAQIIGPALANMRAAEATTRERALYEYALNSLSEAVWLLDGEGRPIFANAEASRIGSLVAPHWNDAGASVAATPMPRNLRRALLRALQEGTEERLRLHGDADGAQTWYDLRIIPLSHPTLKVLFFAADVTAEMTREAERTRYREDMERASRLAALGEMVGGVAHELNNPLTAILGFADVIASDNQAAVFSEELDVIQKEATRARDIVRDLLFIARPGPVELSPVRITDAIDHVTRLRRADWSRRGISVQIDTAAARRTAQGNGHQLIQLLLNLITNAEHALAGRENPCIDIAAEDLQDEVVVTVADNGAGMDRQTLDRIFEPFFTTKQGGGTGLGLSLSYSIVTTHNGRIEVESEPGVGTRFKVSLPLTAELSPTGPEAEASVSQGPLRVLVVDDEPNLRRLCQRMLSSLGHQCEIADGSAQAAALAAAGHFDMVLCDYRLKAETALLVVERIAEVAPDLVDRIVIATGATTDGGVVQLIERYGLRLIAKPYGLDELTRVIQLVVDGAAT